MVAKWIEALTGPLEQKKQYRAQLARIEALPEPYRAAATAVHRYLLHQGGLTDGDAIVRMIGDLADLWERADTDRLGVRQVVGDDPADFAETFAQAYLGARWTDKERDRLAAAIDEAERQEEP